MIPLQFNVKHLCICLEFKMIKDPLMKTPIMYEHKHCYIYNHYLCGVWSLLSNVNICIVCPYTLTVAWHLALITWPQLDTAHFLGLRVQLPANLYRKRAHTHRSRKKRPLNQYGQSVPHRCGAGRRRSRHHLLGWSRSRSVP